MIKQSKFTGALIFIICSIGIFSCEDKYKTTTYYMAREAVFTAYEHITDSVGSLAPALIQQPGKIYFKDGFLFINELKKGVHVINNKDPKNPKFVAFIKIPGNYDIAIQNNILYADCYTDLLAIDISDPAHVVVKNRVNHVFQANINGDYYYDETKNAIVTYRMVERSYEGSPSRPGINVDYLAYSSQNSDKNAAPASNNGKAGSMARFGLYKDYLYALAGNQLKVLNIEDNLSPQLSSSINVNWNIETLFPYKNKLFIGSQTGMYIFDNQDPSSPTFQSMFSHVKSCDPVVVDGDYAYVTLRDGTTCGGFTNQLEVIDIKNLNNPTLIKSYAMGHPYGLGKDKDLLFVCDGSFGLKVYKAADALKIDENLISNFKETDACDVIPLDGTLMMIGKQGLYQFDYSDPSAIKLLSYIPLKAN